MILNCGAGFAGVLGADGAFQAPMRHIPPAAITLWRSMIMGTVEIVLGVVLLIACLIIVLVVLMQDSKDQGLGSAVGGGAADTFFGRNESRTKEAKLNRWTKVSAFLFFAVTLAVNIIIPFLHK